MKVVEYIKKHMIAAGLLAVASGLVLCALSVSKVKYAESDIAATDLPRARLIEEVEPSYPAESPREDVEADEESSEASTATFGETVADMFFSNLERIRDLEAPLGETGVAAFKAMFDALDTDDKVSYAHHAANLIPDENIACLREILMDASESQEVLETIYYDLLNRPEEVKTPILSEVAELESHPLCEDARELISN